MDAAPFQDDVRVITLDLWNTLIHDDPDGGVIRNELRVQGIQLELHGEQLSRERILEALVRCRDVCWGMQYDGVDLSFEEQMSLFFRELDQGLASRLDGATAEAVGRLYAEAFFAHPPKLDPEVPDTLDLLVSKGYRLALISNTGATPGRLFRGYLEELGIRHYFEVLTFSDELRIAKPSPRIFHHTLEQMGVPPSQAVHVGDHLRYDVLGAKGVGMRTVWRRGFDDGVPEVAPDVIIDSFGELAQLL